MIEGALDAALFRRAQLAVRKLGKTRLRDSYWTTFWLPLGAPPAHALEEAALALAAEHAPRRTRGVEWWLGRSYTTSIPVGFHFDQDVKGRALRHPLRSSVLFFNRVRGGQLAVTDQTPASRQATRLETVKPLPNRYALFAGNLLHGVLDAEGRTPGKPLPEPRGRLRVTLVINYWDHRPTNVPTFAESSAYRALRRG